MENDIKIILFPLPPLWLFSPPPPLSSASPPPPAPSSSPPSSSSAPPARPRPPAASASSARTPRSLRRRGGASAPPACALPRGGPRRPGLHPQTPQGNVRCRGWDTDTHTHTGQSTHAGYSVKQRLREWDAKLVDTQVSAWHLMRAEYLNAHTSRICLFHGQANTHRQRGRNTCALKQTPRITSARITLQHISGSIQCFTLGINCRWPMYKDTLLLLNAEQ